MLIKAKLVRRSCSIDDLIHVFINFNFENDLSQLAIENPRVSSNLYGRVTIRPLFGGHVLLFGKK